MELPMLDDEEWRQLTPLLRGFTDSIKRHREHHSSTVQEATNSANPDPALQKYFDLTGFKETNINALWHHQISLYGEPCERCSKPLRTRGAKMCVECGWRKSNNSLECDASKATRASS
jgi:hypothetical protein